VHQQLTEFGVAPTIGPLNRSGHPDILISCLAQAPPTQHDEECYIECIYLGGGIRTKVGACSYFKTFGY
jgi:hypothetical protein